MPKHHYRCHLCGRDFEQFEPWRDHVERRHPEGDERWWLVVEDPSDLPFEVQEP